MDGLLTHYHAVRGLGACGYRNGVLEQVIASQRRRHLVSRSLLLGGHTPWDFQPFFDASEQYMRGHLDLNVLERRTRYPAPEFPPPDRCN